MINNNNNPYLGNIPPTLVTLSAAIALLAISPLVLSHLLQPVQATLQYTIVQTLNPVALGNNCNVANAELTFDAKGNGETLTSGTFKITDSSNSSQTLWSGDFYSATPGSDSSDEEVDIVYNVDNNGLENGLVCGAGTQLWVTTYCTQAPPNPNIILETDAGAMGGVNGAVDCESPSDTTTAQSSSSSSTTGTTTTTTQDSDGDGIPDSSDRCTHNSNPRCFKEGEASTTTTTTTTQQEQPSSNSTGNQTRDR